MKKVLKFTTLLALVVCFFAFCMVSANAQNLFEAKDTGTLAHEGYLINNAGTETNIKFEIRKTGGTDTSPEYTIYFFIDETATDHLQTTSMMAGWNGQGTPASHVVGSDKWVGAGWNDERSQYNYQAFYSAAIANNQIKTAVIGDGITALGGGLIFTGMYIETIEAPTSLKTMNGCQLKDCQQLKTWYTRGDTPVEGTLDLSNFTKLPWDAWYAFSACRSVKHYKFPESVSKTHLINCAFLYNVSLEELTIPEGITELRYEAVTGCDALKTLTVPSTCTKTAGGSIKDNKNLETVTFLGNTSIVYDSTATTKADVLAERITNGTYLNTFSNDPKVGKIVAPAGTGAFDFAQKFSFFTLEDLKPTDTTKCIASGHVIKACGTRNCGKAMSEHEETNIKYEIYNMGTADKPSYTMYFSIDDAVVEGAYADNTILYGWFSGEGSGTHEYGLGNSGSGSDNWKKHSWYVNSSSEAQAIIGKIDTIVVCDGITELKGGAFSLMKSIKTVELPTSLVSLNGAAFKDCINLRSIYTAGQTKEDGVANLTNFTYINFGQNYLFCGCRSIVEYRFADDLAYNGVAAQAVFLFNASLKKVELPEGITTISKDVFDATALEEVTIPSTVKTINGSAFYNSASLKTINILGDTSIVYPSTATTKEEIIGTSVVQDSCAFGGCVSLETINAPFYSKAHDFAIKFGFNTTNYYDNGSAYLEFDAETGTLTASKSSSAGGWYELQNDGAGMTKKFFDTYRSQVKHIEIESFPKIKEGGFMFRNYPNLETIHFAAAAQRISVGSVGLFSGNPKLKELWYGTEINHVANTANISNVHFDVKQWEYPGKYLDSIFNGCESLEGVMLFSQTFIETFVDNGTTYTVEQPRIKTSSFNGCTSLKSITIPENMPVDDGAFDTCTALTAISITAVNFEDSVGIFPDREGLTITTVSKNFDESNYAHTTVLVIANTVKSEGFSIRYSDYNGLRCLYSFDNTKKDLLEANGIELVEYGALVVSKDNYDVLGKAVVGKIATGYISNAAAVQKVAVWQDGEYVNKILDTSTADRTQFAVTITKFDDHFRSDIYTCAYSVYRDSNGNDYVEYANYGDIEGKEAYKFVNIYGITMGMAYDGLFDNKIVEEEAIWNIFYQGKPDAIKTIILGDNNEYKVETLDIGTDVIVSFYGLDCAKHFFDSDDAMSQLNDKLNEIYADSTATGYIIMSVDDDPDFTPAYVTDTPKTELTKTVSAGPYKRDNVDKAQHPQGMASDGEHIYVSFTGLIVKIRLSDNTVVGTWKPGIDDGFHMGDLTYYNGYIYGSLTGWGTEKAFVARIAGDSFDLDDSNDAKELYGAFIPDGCQISKNEVGLGSEYMLSDGTRKYAFSGIDGIDYGKIPGGGWIDAEGNVHEDDNTYLLVTIGGGVPTSSSDPDTRYDNDVYAICAYSFEDIEAAMQPIDATRFKSATEETAILDCTYRMFIYTGASCYGAQTFVVDKDTGDYIVNMYNRPSGSVYPSCYAVVIDGSKMLYMDEIEVGQSSTNEDAKTRAALYADENGNYPTGLFMSLKCTCGKCDIDAHDKVAYGDTGYAFRFCSSLSSYSNGIISLGNDYYYTLGAWGSDKDGWNVSIKLNKLEHYLNKWAYTPVN